MIQPLQLEEILPVHISQAVVLCMFHHVREVSLYYYRCNYIVYSLQLISLQSNVWLIYMLCIR